MYEEYDESCCAIEREVRKRVVIMEKMAKERQQEEQEREQAGEYGSPNHNYNGNHDEHPGWDLQQAHLAISIRSVEKIVANGSTFVTYRIEFGRYEVKRRYSEFESLRKVLCRIYPTLLVPVLPEKHTIVQYATGRSKMVEDKGVVEKRKRMLGRFLSRIAEHPILSSEHIFHRFLENGVAWNEVLNSPLILSLPDNPLYSSPSKGVGSSVAADPAQAVTGGLNALPKIAAVNKFAADVPIPNALVPLANQEVRWVACKLFTNKFMNIWSTKIEPTQKKLNKRFEELADGYTELGGLLNGISLEEGGDISRGIEYAGQAVDGMYTAMNQMKTDIEGEYMEYVHEYALFGTAVNQVLGYRTIKNIQLEKTIEKLKTKKGELESLLAEEKESRRENDQGKYRDDDRSEYTVGSPMVEEQTQSDIESEPEIPEEGRVISRISSEYPVASHRKSMDSVDNIDEIMSQFHLEQSAMWSEGTPRALPQQYNPRSDNKMTRKARSSNYNVSATTTTTTKTTTTKTKTANARQNGTTTTGTTTGTTRPNLVARRTISSHPMKGTQSEPTPGKRRDSLERTTGNESLITPVKSLLSNSILNRFGFSLGRQTTMNEQERHARIEEITAKITEYERVYEMLRDDLAIIDESTQEDLDRYQLSKVRDFKYMLLCLSKEHIHCNAVSLDGWKVTLNYLNSL